MTGDDAVAVLSADRNAGLSQDCRSIGHVFVAGTQIERHFKLHFRNLYYTENLIAESIFRQIKTICLISLPAVQTFLPGSVEPFVVVPDIQIEVFVGHRDMLLNGILLYKLCILIESLALLLHLPSFPGAVYQRRQSIVGTESGKDHQQKQENHSKRFHVCLAFCRPPFQVGSMA